MERALVLENAREKFYQLYHFKRNVEITCTPHANNKLLILLRHVQRRLNIYGHTLCTLLSRLFLFLHICTNWNHRQPVKNLVQEQLWTWLDEQLSSARALKFSRRHSKTCQYPTHITTPTTAYQQNIGLQIGFTAHCERSSLIHHSKNEVIVWNWILRRS